MGVRFMGLGFWVLGTGLVFGIEVVGFRVHGVRSRVYGARELRFIFRLFFTFGI
jgi:hypothetical protein